MEQTTMLFKVNSTIQQRKGAKNYVEQWGEFVGVFWYSLGRDMMRILNEGFQPARLPRDMADHVKTMEGVEDIWNAKISIG